MTRGTKFIGRKVGKPGQSVQMQVYADGWQAVCTGVLSGRSCSKGLEIAETVPRLIEPD